MEALQYVFSRSSIDVVSLVTLNINCFSQIHSKTLTSLMKSLDYSQFVSAGTLLDHVYVKATSIPVKNCSIVSVYCSDHDAVVTSLQYSK